MKDKVLYFIAITLPGDLQNEVQEIKQKLAEQTGSHQALKNIPHITLVPPFYMNAEEYKVLFTLLNEKKRLPDRMEITIKNYNHFRQDVIFLDVLMNEELTILAGELRKITGEVTGHTPVEDSFHPHITLSFRDLRKEAFKIAWEELKNKKYHATFTPEGYWLFRHDGKKWDLLNQFF